MVHHEQNKHNVTNAPCSSSEGINTEKKVKEEINRCHCVDLRKHYINDKCCVFQFCYLY